MKTVWAKIVERYDPVIGGLYFGKKYRFYPVSEIRQRFLTVRYCRRCHAPIRKGRYSKSYSHLGLKRRLTFMQVKPKYYHSDVATCVRKGWQGYGEFMQRLYQMDFD